MTQQKLFEDQSPVDGYDMVAMWISNFGEKRRMKKMYRRQLKDRIVAKIEGDPLEFGIQLGIGILLSVATAKLTKGVMRKTFMPKAPKPEEVAMLWLSTGDLDLINNALKEATNGK